MFVGTIHAFALELLKSEVPKYLRFEVLNEVQQSLFIDRNSRKSGLTTSTDINGAALKRYRDTPLYLSALSILRETDLDDEALAKEDHRLSGGGIMKLIVPGDECLVDPKRDEHRAEGRLGHAQVEPPLDGHRVQNRQGS